MELAVGRGDGTEVSAPPPPLLLSLYFPPPPLPLSCLSLHFRAVGKAQQGSFYQDRLGTTVRSSQGESIRNPKRPLFRFVFRVSCFVFRTVCLLCLSVGNTTVDAALPFASGLPEISRCQPNPGAIRQRDDVDEPAVCRRYCLAQTQPAVFKMKRLCCFFLWGRNRRVSVLVSFYSFCFILFRFILFCFVSFLFRIGRSY
eukprot:COSAG06_NODE_3575_length_5170_cov_2.403668_4_plen_200_part_00